VYFQGTEPPEPEHRKPVAPSDPSAPSGDPDDPKNHEEGEVKVGQVLFIVKAECNFLNIFFKK